MNVYRWDWGRCFGLDHFGVAHWPVAQNCYGQCWRPNIWWSSPLKRNAFIKLNPELQDEILKRHDIHPKKMYQGIFNEIEARSA